MHFNHISFYSDFNVIILDATTLSKPTNTKAHIKEMVWLDLYVKV